MAAGALIPQGAVIPPRSLVAGYRAGCAGTQRCRTGRQSPQMRLSMNILLICTAKRRKRKNNDGVDFGGSCPGTRRRGGCGDGDPDGVRDSHRRSGLPGSSSTADSANAVSGSTGPPGDRPPAGVRNRDYPAPRRRPAVARSGSRHPSRAGSASTDRRRSTPHQGRSSVTTPRSRNSRRPRIPTSAYAGVEAADPPAAAEGTRPPVAGRQSRRRP